MENRKFRKGFTLVELIVVIAIIAILAAVSVVSYMAFINQANESADIQLVKQLNTALQGDEVINNKRSTMHEMLGAMSENGFVVENLTKTKSGNDIVWDQQNNRFALLNSDNKLVYGEESYSSTAGKEYNVWRFAASANDLEKNKNYSFYLTEAFEKNEEVKTLNIESGLDAGEYAKLEEINYSNETAQKVTIRTNGGNLTVDGINDDVKHYGWLNSLTVTAVNSENCYHEFGYLGELKSFGEGKFVAENSAVFHQTKEAIETILGEKPYELKNGAKYNEHLFDPETGECEIDDCDEVDPSVAPISPDEQGIEGVTPQIKIVEGADDALNLELDTSEMGEYADQVDYYEITYSTKVAVTSDTYNLDEETEFELNFDSRASTSIPYIGWTCVYASNMAPNGSKNNFKTSNDIKYEFISGVDTDYYPFKNVLWIVEDAVIQKAMINNHNISVNESVSCVFSYADFRSHYYINLTEDEYKALCDVYGENIDVFKEVEDANGKYEIDVEAGFENYEDLSNYVIKAYKSDGTLLGKNEYGNAYSQWKNNEDILSISDEYKNNNLNNEDSITETLVGNSNTFGFYQYVLDKRGSTTKFWTDKIEN